MTVKDIPLNEARDISKLDREHLKLFEVKPPEIFKTGKRKRLKPKQCYIQAFEYMADHDDNIQLVHGLYKPVALDVHSGHAWVEIDGKFIFDGVLQSFYDKTGYFNYYEAIEEQRYTQKEMYQKGLEHGGHYGPWH